MSIRFHLGDAGCERFGDGGDAPADHKAVKAPAKRSQAVDIADHGSVRPEPSTLPAEVAALRVEVRDLRHGFNGLRSEFHGLCEMVEALRQAQSSSAPAAWVEGKPSAKASAALGLAYDAKVAKAAGVASALLAREGRKKPKAWRKPVTGL